MQVGYSLGVHTRLASSAKGDSRLTCVKQSAHKANQRTKRRQFHAHDMALQTDTTRCRIFDLKCSDFVCVSGSEAVATKITINFVGNQYELQQTFGRL